MGYRKKVRKDGGKVTPKRRDAVKARRDAVDWDNPSYGGLVRGDKLPEVGFGNALHGLKSAILPKK